MSQKARIVALLSQAGSRGVCGTELLEAHMPRYAARIYDIKADGHTIGKRRCALAGHDHESPQTIYELIPPAEGEQMRLADDPEAWIADAVGFRPLTDDEQAAADAWLKAQREWVEAQAVPDHWYMPTLADWLRLELARE